MLKKELAQTLTVTLQNYYEPGDVNFKKLKNVKLPSRFIYFELTDKETDLSAFIQKGFVCWDNHYYYDYYVNKVLIRFEIFEAPNSNNFGYIAIEAKVIYTRTLKKNAPEWMNKFKEEYQNTTWGCCFDELYTEHDAEKELGFNYGVEELNRLFNEKLNHFFDCEIKLTI